MYEVIGTYRGDWEVIDSADSRREAEYLATEYRMAYSRDWLIHVTKAGK